MTTPVPPPRQDSLFRRAFRFLARLVTGRRAARGASFREQQGGYQYPSPAPQPEFFERQPAGPLPQTPSMSRQVAATALPVEADTRSTTERFRDERAAMVQERLDHLTPAHRPARSITTLSDGFYAPDPGSQDAGVDPSWSLRQGIQRIYEDGPPSVEEPRRYADDPLTLAGRSFVQQLSTETGLSLDRVVTTLGAPGLAAEDTLHRAAELVVDARGHGNHRNRAEAVQGVEQAMHNQLRDGLRAYQTRLTDNLQQPDPLAGAGHGGHLGGAAVRTALDELAHPSGGLTVEDRRVQQEAIRIRHQLDPEIRRTINPERDPQPWLGLAPGATPLSADPDRQADWVLWNGLAKLQRNATDTATDPTVLAAERFVEELSASTGHNFRDLLNQLVSVPDEQTLRTAAKIIQEHNGLATDGPDGARAGRTIEASMRTALQASIRDEARLLELIAADPGQGRQIPTGARIGNAGVLAGHDAAAGIRADRGLPPNPPQRLDTPILGSAASQAAWARAQLDPSTRLPLAETIHRDVPADQVSDHQLRAGLEMLAQAGGNHAAMTGLSREDPLVHAASGLTRAIADRTGLSYQDVLDELNSPDVPAGETLTRAAELLHQSEDLVTMGTLPGSSETEIAGLSDTMRTEWANGVQQTADQYAAVAGNPSGGAPMPKPAGVGMKAVSTADRQLTDIVGARMDAYATAVLDPGAGRRATTTAPGTTPEARKASPERFQGDLGNKIS